MLLPKYLQDGADILRKNQNILDGIETDKEKVEKFLQELSNLVPRVIRGVLSPDNIQKLNLVLNSHDKDGDKFPSLHRVSKSAQSIIIGDDIRKVYSSDKIKN